MALKITNVQLESTYLTPFADSVSIGIKIPKKVLSEPYTIKSGDLISGKILYASDLEEGGVIIKGLENKEIVLAFKSALVGDKDYLLISKDSWNILRDYGALPGRCIISLKLDKITEKIDSLSTFIRDGEVLTKRSSQREVQTMIYPQRDIEV